MLLRFTLALVMVVLTAPRAPAQTAFRSSLKEGDKLKYVIEDDSATIITSGNRVFDLKQSLVLDTVWDVRRLGSDGNAEIVVTVERVRLNAEGKGAAAFGRIAFDSKETREPQARPEIAVAAVLKAVVGSEFKVSLNMRGSITRFELPEKLSVTLQENTTRELAGFFGDLFTPQGLRHRLTHWLVAFPDQPASVGQTWTEEKASRLGEPLKSKRTYVYAAPEERDGNTVQKIDITPALIVPDEVRARSEARIKSEEGRGTVYFDARSGRITEWVLSEKLVLQMSYAETSFEGKTSVKLAPAK